MAQARWNVVMQFNPPPDMTSEQATTLAKRLRQQGLSVDIDQAITVRGQAAASIAINAATAVKLRVKRVWVEVFGGDVRNAPGPESFSSRRVG
jgi:hypothetical protein